MTKNSMRKEVVLTRLRAWFQYYRISEGILEQDKQAYAQLVEIVEGHFILPDEVDERLADMVFDSKFEAFKRGRQEGRKEADSEEPDPVENNKTDTQEVDESLRDRVNRQNILAGQKRDTQEGVEEEKWRGIGKDGGDRLYWYTSEGGGVDEDLIRRKADELMCDVDSGDEVANYEFLHDFAKQLLTQNAALHKELKSLEEESFREEIDDGKALEWLDKFQDALATNNDSDYRETKSKLKQLLQQKQQKRVDEEEQEQPPMDKETAADKKYHELKDEDRLDRFFGRRKE